MPVFDIKYVRYLDILCTVNLLSQGLTSLPGMNSFNLTLLTVLF